MIENQQNGSGAFASATGAVEGAAGRVQGAADAIQGAAGAVQSAATAAQGMLNSRQISDALDKLRATVDQTSKLLRDFGQQSGQWTQAAQDRAGEMARQLRDQSGVAVDSMSRQIESSPMTSVMVAFGIGFLCAAGIAAMMRR